MKKFFESSNIFERRAFLATFIESLEVDDGEITFNYGLPPDGAKQETVSVLGIVPPAPPMGRYLELPANFSKIRVGWDTESFFSNLPLVHREVRVELDSTSD